MYRNWLDYRSKKRPEMNGSKYRSSGISLDRGVHLPETFHKRFKVKKREILPRRRKYRSEVHPEIILQGLGMGSEEIILLCPAHWLTKVVEYIYRASFYSGSI